MEYEFSFPVKVSKEDLLQEKMIYVKGKSVVISDPSKIGNYISRIQIEPRARIVDGGGKPFSILSFTYFTEEKIALYMLGKFVRKPQPKQVISAHSFSPEISERMLAEFMEVTDARELNDISLPNLELVGVSKILDMHDCKQMDEMLFN
ncbi:MAG: hypothetical protein HYW26_05675 [Candidatus Aenigmarchaeota archaeon]|nr:hypothetical protein [Candidatus Aenigmarchaeota archaeon]